MPVTASKVDVQGRAKSPNIKTGEGKKPLVKFVRRPDGSYRFPESVKLTKKDITAAIRADRDHVKISSTEDFAEAAADTWEKLGPAPRIRSKKLPKK